MTDNDEWRENQTKKPKKGYSKNIFMFPYVFGAHADIWAKQSLTCGVRDCDIKVVFNQTGRNEFECGNGHRRLINCQNIYFINTNADKLPQEIQNAKTEEEALEQAKKLGVYGQHFTKEELEHFGWGLEPGDHLYFSINNSGDEQCVNCGARRSDDGVHEQH
jgi:hypothetical protein